MTGTPPAPRTHAHHCTRATRLTQRVGHTVSNCGGYHEREVNAVDDRPIFDF
eukprot:SAG11_NODE_1741_length_4336_cov_1.517583_5_plen_52_part_00